MQTTRARVAVTGATNGIGLAIAHRLAGDGWPVTMIGRSDDRLAAACQNIQEAVPEADLAVERADFSALDDVRALAARLIAGPPLEVVISNAATVAELDARGADGLQRTLTVNHLAPYLLLRLITEGPSSPARIVVVGADPVLLAQNPVDLDRLDAPPDRPDMDPDLAPFALYGRTKNMNVMMLTSLANRLRESGRPTTVNGAHPGIIKNTSLSKEAPRVNAAVAARFDIDFDALPDADVGADTPVWLATSSQVAEITGQFFVERRPVETAAHTTDPERCEQLWQLSAHLVGLPDTPSDTTAPE